MDYVTKTEFNKAIKTVNDRLDYLEFDVRNLRQEFSEFREEMRAGMNKIFGYFDRENKESDILAAEVASAHVRIGRVEHHLGLAI